MDVQNEEFQQQQPQKNVKKDALGNEIKEGAEVSWLNLSYKIPSKISKFTKCKRYLQNCKFPWLNKKKKKKEYSGEDEEKVLLKPFSGLIKANSLVAVMGSSGAGKTTFLNALSFQMEGGVREGSVYLNNRKLTKSYFKKTCGYVRQSDVLLPNLTVKETLTFYANLLLPMTMPPSEKEDRVLSTIQKLAPCMDTKIGNDFKRGISGGEKRRVSIAIELLKNPAVLFLDEPTSGLDSKTALSLILTLSELVHEYNHTIMCTIHQPRAMIFEQFDTLLLLAKGSVVYFGPANEAIDYFAKKGYNCPQYENPPDYFIDLLTLDTESEEGKENSTNRVNYFIEEAKDDVNKNAEIVSASLEQNINSPDFSKRKEVSSFGTFFPYQIWLLLERSITNKWRDTQYLFGRVAQTFFMAFAVSIIWWQMDTDQSSIQDRISVLFILLLGSAFSEGLVASLVFPMERMVYIQEKRAGMYRVISYYFAKQLAEFPLQLIVPSIFILIVYFAAGLQYSSVHFANFLLICLLLNFIVNSFGLLFGALFQAQLAAVLMPVCLIFTMLFAGFYVNTENIPVFLTWAKYVSVFYYAYSGIIYVEFWGRTFYCKDGQEYTLTGTATCASGEVVTATTSLCPITHGQQIIDRFGSDAFTLYQIELILLAFLLFLRFLLFFALINPPKRI